MIQLHNKVSKKKKLNIITDEFGEAAAQTFEPLLRGSMIYLFSRCPQLSDIDDFGPAITEHIILQYEILKRKKFESFLYFEYNEYEIILRSLKESYDYYVTSIFTIIKEELLNPSYRGFSTFQVNPFNRDTIEQKQNNLECFGIKYIKNKLKSIEGSDGIFTHFYSFLSENGFDVSGSENQSVATIKAEMKTLNIGPHQIIFLFGIINIINFHFEYKGKNYFCPILEWDVKQFTDFFLPEYFGALLAMFFSIYNQCPTFTRIGEYHRLCENGDINVLNSILQNDITKYFGKENILKENNFKILKVNHNYIFYLIY